MKLSFLYDETSIIPNFATNSDAMKVTLDLDQLKNEGRITAEEYNRLRKFAAEATVSLAGGLSVRSGSMAALSSFMFLGALGGMTGYMHAMYFLCVEQPTLTIAVFAIMSAIAGAMGNRLPIRFSRPVKSFAASAFVIVNLAFWIGSLWGDRSRFGGESAMVFVVTWRSFSFSWLRGPPLPTGVGSSRQERCSLSSTFTRSGLSVCH